MDFKTIRNNSSVLQYVIHKGTQVRLGPFAEETIDSGIAALFLEKCSPVVVEVTDTEKNTIKDNQETIWVANVTGNPDAPPKIKVRQWVSKGKHEMVEVDNPHFIASVQLREWDEGSVEKKLADGTPFWYNLTKQPVAIAPFKRRELRKDIGTWFLRQDAQMFYGKEGSAILSRPPSEFEPDMSWPLNEMRDYLRCIDPDATLGPDEEQVAANVKKAKVVDPKVLAEKLREAKDKCYKRCLMRIFNPAYRLPTKAEFHEFKTGQSAEDLEASQIAALLSKAEEANGKPAAA